MSCCKFFSFKKNKIKYIKQYKLVYEKIKFPEWWDLFYIQITNLSSSLNNNNPTMNYVITDECAIILLTYVYLPHYLYKLNKPSVCSLYLLPENYSDTTVFLNNNKDYGNYTLHHGLLTKSAQFLLNKKYNNVEWFTTITIILKPKLNSITLTINNNDFKLLHPKVLYDNIKDFKGRTINYNNNNEKNYIKVLKRIIKNLEYEQIINE